MGTAWKRRLSCLLCAVTLLATIAVRATSASAAPRCKRNCDTVVPGITVSSPIAGATVSGSVVVQGTATDNTAVAKVEVRIDGGDYQLATGTGGWAWTWSTSAFGDGAHTVLGRATDSSGNTSTASVTVHVVNRVADTNAPNVTISSPADGAAVSGTVAVSGTASDDAAVARVQVSVDDGPWQTATGGASWSWTWDSRGVTNGTHALRAQAVDTAGNGSPPVGVAVTVQNAAAPLGRCSDGSPVLAQDVTPEGARLAICTTAGGWTTTSLSNLLRPNALDLDLIGPRLTVQIQTGAPTSAGTSAACCDAAGRYYGYAAVITLNPSATSSFSAAPDAVLAHEYGHAWTYYWHYMNPENNGSWARYNAFRWATADGSQVLAQHPKLNTAYSWMDYELAADDYRRLFGTPTAQSQLAYMNANLPDSQQVSGLAGFFLDGWR